jgi:hypothetical protein
MTLSLNEHSRNYQMWICETKMVELRYFGGLSRGDTASVLKVSIEAVTQDGRLARGLVVTPDQRGGLLQRGHLTVRGR